MQDQQVEVVSGSHAAARVAGAVVLVAHRGQGRPTEDSPAVRALVALIALVYEAAARQPDGPGASIAREATRWLMARAERVGPESSIDFGILSAAGPGRVAIFLHGAVTAVVAGEDTEYFHGRDAVFTVDRTAAIPSRAVALFVDEPSLADDDDYRPELPAARGIGRLVEGIAEAGGAIAWSPVGRPPAPASGTGRTSGVVLGKRVERAADETARTHDDRETPVQPGGNPATAARDDRESPPRPPDTDTVDAGRNRGGEGQQGTGPGSGAITSAGRRREDDRSPSRRPEPDEAVTAGNSGDRETALRQSGSAHSTDDPARSGRELPALGPEPADVAADPVAGDSESPPASPDQDDGVTGAATPPVDSVQLSARATVTSTGARGSETGGHGRAGDSGPPDTDPHHAQTEISGRQQPRAAGDRPTGEGFDETADPRSRRAGSAHGSLVHPTPHMDLPVPQHGPPERGTPPLDAELRRRTEATAKGTALTVKVRGFKCARAHPTDPRSAFCSVCGMPVDQTQPLIEVVRPPLGILVLDDGATYLLDGDAVLGRDPEKSEPARRGLTPLQVSDNSGGMSRAHIKLLLVEWEVTLVDRGSTNGTRTRAPGYREWVRVPPHQPVVLVAGTEILIGKRMLRFEAAAPPPFGA
jgi:hypothetical protein